MRYLDSEIKNIVLERESINRHDLLKIATLNQTDPFSFCYQKQPSCEKTWSNTAKTLGYFKE